MSSPTLRERSQLFAGEVQETLSAILPSEVRIVAVNLAGTDRFWVRPSGDTPKEQRIPLSVGGEHLADLGLQLYLGMDWSGRYLKTLKSSITAWSVLDRTPLVRQEFDADERVPPISHWHFHADRGAFSHLLARAHALNPDQVAKPHDLSSLHFPVGGERFRPCLEDFLQFLVQECGVDACPDWLTAVESGRARWRRRQLRSAVRDLQQDAAEVLRENGWTVTPPESGSEDSTKALVKW